MPVLDQPAVQIKIIEIARRHESGIAVAGVPHTRQGSDPDFVNEGVGGDLSAGI